MTAGHPKRARTRGKPVHQSPCRRIVPTWLRMYLTCVTLARFPVDRPCRNIRPKTGRKQLTMISHRKRLHTVVQRQAARRLPIGNTQRQHMLEKALGRSPVCCLVAGRRERRPDLTRIICRRRFWREHLGAQNHLLVCKAIREGTHATHSALPHQVDWLLSSTQAHAMHSLPVPPHHRSLKQPIAHRGSGRIWSAR